MSKRLGGIIGCQDKTSSWHSNGFPDGSNVGSTLSWGEYSIVWSLHNHMDTTGRPHRTMQTDQYGRAPNTKIWSHKRSDIITVVVVVVSHIQRIGCQPEKNYFTRWPIPLVVC